MDRVEDLFENVLSVAIYDLFPSLKGHQIKNRLLDGSLHVQTIGNPIKFIRFRCVSDDCSMNIINQIEFYGQEIKVFYDDKYYIGIIDELSEWQEELFGEKDTRLYTANISVAVSEEGVIE